MGMRPPFGAWKIVEARKQGKRPADMVLISLIGKLNTEANPVVQALPEADHDWSWARGLTVCFWSTPEEYTPKHIIDCWKAEPKKIYLWDARNARGYDIFVVATEDTILLPFERRKFLVEPLRWMPFQEKNFAEGEQVWN